MSFFQSLYVIALICRLRLVPRLSTREIRTSQLVLFIAATHVFLATPANVLFVFYLYDQVR